MADLRPRRLRKMSITTVIALVLTTAVSTAVIAAHSFTDVPDDNTFHSDIAWLKDYRVTRGCNPPANTEFCPSDNVTREQMAAFMRRLSQTTGSTGDQVTDSTSPVTVDSTTFVALATINVRPLAEVKVNLNGHASIEVDADGAGTFEVVVARDSCSGTVVGSGTWGGTHVEGDTNTVSITGFDETDSDTTYVLCAAKDLDESADGSALSRGLTGSWEPAR
jgi:hypothetical protein